VQTYLIPAVWLLITFFCISKLNFYKLPQITPGFRYAAFFYKVVLGVLNYYIWLNVIGHGDSLRYVHDSLIVYNSLFENPGHFFELITRSSLENIPEHLLSYQKELYIEWHVNEYHMVRLLAILNVFTFGNEWANIIIISWLGFTVSIGLFKSLHHFFIVSEKQNRWLFFAIFLLPSVIFWSGGLLKEGPTFILLCIIAIQLFKIEFSADRSKTPGVPLFIIVLCLWMMLLVRDYLAILLCANLVLWFFSRSFVKPERSIVAFLVGSGFTVVLLFILPMLLPQYNFFVYAQQEQQYFLSAEPDADYHFEAIGGNSIDVAKQIPYVLNNILFRPNFLASSNFFRLYQSIELLLVWGLIFYFMFRHVLKKTRFTLSGMMLLIISIELLFIYGLLVTDADTLSRYRSIPLFLILTMFIAPEKKSDSLVSVKN
jgi:hypothetical protein